MSRFFEILPGALAWLTLILVVVLSSQAPAFVAVFIILFDIYWLLKSLYLSFHLRSTFREMKKNLGVDWLRKLKEEERDANAANTMRMPRIVEKELSYRLNGVLFRVHNQLGRFARERQYGDVLAQELERERIPFLREAALEIAGRKSNFADFLVDGKIAVELKAKSFVDKEDYYQIQRYLQTANLKLGLIVNFRERHLKAHRVLNADTEEKTQFADSHVFEDSHRGISWREIHHLVILPMYQEPHALVRESFLSLIRSNYPKDKMVVVLATEERAYTRESGVGSGEWGVAETARRIQAEFGNEFLRLLVTVHPAGLPGELAGKGSNETWAAKEAKRLIIDPLLERDANAANTMGGLSGFVRRFAWISRFGSRRLILRQDIGVRLRRGYPGLPRIFRPADLRVPALRGPPARGVPAHPAFREQYFPGAGFGAHRRFHHQLLADDAAIPARTPDHLLLAVGAFPGTEGHRILAHRRGLRGFPHLLAGIPPLSRRVPGGAAFLSGIHGC